MVNTNPQTQNNSPWNFPGLPEIEECPEGLVPIGDTGFYMTPGHPISPTDCDLWPSSPYCGGNPINWGNFAGMDFAIIHDECNIGVQFTPTFGFISLPPLTVVWRDPDCVEEEPPDTPPIVVEDIEVETGCGVYMMPYTFFFPTIQIKKVLSATKVSQPYLWYSDLVENWDIYYKDCNDVIHKLINFEDDFKHYIAYEHLIDPQGNPYQKRIPPIKRLDYGCPCGTPVLPPPLPNFPCCMPQCCPPQNDALLQLILDKVEKLSTVVGVEEYPAELPESLISKIQVDKDKIGATIEPGTIQIPSLTKLAAWLIERIDELFGQWEIPIEIKDSDATTPGDQPKGVVLPNLAEYAGETFLMQYSMLVNMEALISMCTRSLIEAGQIKQQGYVAYQSIQAIMDYLGFKVVDKKTSIPLTFTPGKEDLGELLTSSNVSIVVPEFGDKVGLPVDLHRIRKACGIIEAQGWRNVDLNNPDLLGQVLGGIYKSRQILADMLEKEEDNWDNFKEQTEQGYSNEALHPTPNKPYGKPYDQRPKIKELGTSAAAEAIDNLPTGNSQ